MTNAEYTARSSTWEEACFGMLIPEPRHEVSRIASIDLCDQCASGNDAVFYKNITNSHSCLNRSANWCQESSHGREKNNNHVMQQIARISGRPYDVYSKEDEGKSLKAKHDLRAFLLSMTKCFKLSNDPVYKELHKLVSHLGLQKPLYIYGAIPGPDQNILSRHGNIWDRILKNEICRMEKVPSAFDHNAEEIISDSEDDGAGYPPGASIWTSRDGAGKMDETGGDPGEDVNMEQPTKRRKIVGADKLFEKYEDFLAESRKVKVCLHCNGDRFIEECDLLDAEETMNYFEDLRKKLRDRAEGIGGSRLINGVKVDELGPKDRRALDTVINRACMVTKVQLPTVAELMDDTPDQWFMLYSWYEVKAKRTVRFQVAALKLTLGELRSPLLKEVASNCVINLHPSQGEDSEELWMWPVAVKAAAAQSKIEYGGQFEEWRSGYEIDVGVANMMGGAYHETTFKNMLSSICS
eukprot:s114_g24.t1